MPAFESDSIAVRVDGTTVTSSGSTARVAIPVRSDTTKAAYVRIQATGFVYIQCGDSTVAATTSSMMVSANEGIYLMVKGCTHIAYLQETASAKVNITPIEF